MTAYDYSDTRNDIINGALELIGAKTPGDPLSADQESVASKALNRMVKAWQAKNIFIWNYVENTITLVAGTTAYAGPTNPIVGCEYANLVVGTSDIPLKILSMRQYEENIMDKAATGTPSCLVVVPTVPMSFIVWPNPVASGSIRCLNVVTTQDFDLSTDTGGFPQEWLEALVYNLATRLFSTYPIPLGEREQILTMAKDMLADARKSNREKPTDDFVRGAF